jgi:hypothetical protein
MVTNADCVQTCATANIQMTCAELYTILTLSALIVCTVVLLVYYIYRRHRLLKENVNYRVLLSSPGLRHASTEQQQDDPWAARYELEMERKHRILSQQHDRLTSFY